MKHLIVFGALALSLSAFAADVHDVWSASAKPATLAGGAVAFAYDGSGNVSAVTATPADGATIWLTGDKIPFAADATITVAAEGRLQLSNEVSCAGNLSVFGSGDIELQWNEGKKTFLSTNAYETMFADMDLDDWEPVAFRGDVSGNVPSGCSCPNRFDAFYRRLETVGGEKRMTVDLIAQSSTSTYRKFIRILLLQDGAAVKGKTVGAWYAANSPKASDSIEEELLDPGSDVTAVGLATTEKSSGGRYGVTQLTMRRVRPAAVVRFDGKVTIPNGKRIYAKSAATVEGSMGSVSYPTSSYVTPNVDASGAFEYWAVTNAPTYLRSVFSGSGSVCIRGSQPIPRKNNDSVFDEFSSGGYVNPTKAAWIADERFAVDVTNVTAFFAGTEGGTTKATLLPAKLYHMKADNASGTWRMAQLQAVTNGLVKCAYVRLSHSDNGIANNCLYAQLVSAWSLPNAAPYSLGVDFDDYQSVATSLSVASGSFGAQGLCVYNTRLQFAEPRASRLFGQMRSDGANGMTSPARFIVEGSENRTVRFLAAHTNALPVSGTVEVRRGGDLHLVTSGVTGRGYNGGGAKISVRKGGLLRQYTTYPVGDSQKVYLDGGAMRTGYLRTIDGDGDYFQFLTFRDGARVHGNPIRVGQRVAAPFYTVCGSEPSTLDADLVLAAASASTFQLRVGDVTGDAEADFVINGDIRHSDANTYLAVAKYGPGTVRMNGCHRQKRPVEIHAGAWCLGKSGVTNADANNPSDFVLCGGSLAAAAGAVNTIGTLSANGTGTIAIASGAQLTVSTLDLSGATEAVVIDADLKADSLRIGNGTAPVSQQTMRKLKQLVGGKLCSVHTDADGWVREGGAGMMVFLR